MNFFFCFSPKQHNCNRLSRRSEATEHNLDHHNKIVSSTGWLYNRESTPAALLQFPFTITHFSCNILICVISSLLTATSGLGSVAHFFPAADAAAVFPAYIQPVTSGGTQINDK